ncbi:MAG: prolyl oligopeptidase family serine peptidase [Anaerolineales bacterium]
MTPSKMTKLLLAMLFLLSACNPSTPVPTPILTPTQTHTPAPPATATATFTATPSLTATPVPHPLSIEGMRQRTYPGSQIVIEETLKPGANYERYYVSYLSEGLKIYALLTVPEGEKPASGWPVIVFNHGYIPPEIYRTTERYTAYVDLIARSGYMVLRPDYRGHDRSEGEARGAYSNPDYVIDVLNAVTSIKQHPDADPERIGMWGHSMGGYITLRSMVITQDIKAGVIWAGVVASYPDLLTKWRRSGGAVPTPRPNSWRTNLITQYGDWEENPEFWNAISANTYLHEISGPIQLHHGTRDTDVPLEFSELLFYQMLEADQYVELYKYSGDNHNISNYFNLAMQRTIEFFDRFVKGP